MGDCWIPMHVLCCSCCTCLTKCSPRQCRLPSAMLHSTPCLPAQRALTLSAEEPGAQRRAVPIHCRHARRVCAARAVRGCARLGWLHGCCATVPLPCAATGRHNCLGFVCGQVFVFRSPHPALTLPHAPRSLWPDGDRGDDVRAAHLCHQPRRPLRDHQAQEVGWAGAAGLGQVVDGCLGLLGWCATQGWGQGA